MKFSEEMTSKQKIDALERYVLIHSILYYSLDDSVISDKSFDKAARLLAKKIDKYGPEKIKKTQYGYVFYDFDGNTGFDLMDRLKKSDRKYLTHIAKHVSKLYRGRIGA